MKRAHRSSELTPITKVDHKVVRYIRSSLLDWFHQNGRTFPWRNEGVSSFMILVTEVLLSKTRAELVGPIAARVLDRYPSPSFLARANETKLAELLYPLGLHRKRARNLIRCAKAILKDHAGMVPSAVSDLACLPSIGRYAAHAIACVAFDQRVGVIDANVARIYQRVFSLPAPQDRLSNAHVLWDIATRIVPKQRYKEFNWALLDLGGTICIAKKPRCDCCPISKHCSTGLQIIATRAPASSRAPRVRQRSRRAT